MQAIWVEVGNINWQEKWAGEGDLERMVEDFENITGEIIDRLFPLKTMRVRSNEPAWITDGVRRLDRKKRRVYKREGKPSLMALHYEILAVPVWLIFNAIFRTGKWPRRWKIETTVVIPKVANRGRKILVFIWAK